jgi:hypothetical protein
MKQYDYLFHPDPNCNGEWTVQGMDLEAECVEREEGPVIVLTIEEARQLWNAAQDRMIALRTGYPGDTKIFEAFMESKGITL